MSNERARPDSALLIMGVMGAMFLGICIAMHLFSRARFQKRGNAFATAARLPPKIRRAKRNLPSASVRLSMSSYDQSSRRSMTNASELSHALQTSTKLANSSLKSAPIGQPGQFSSVQMTNSIRKCFNQDQNIMLNIILLAFSLIGIIGLTISNRFVLIIFAACMTLILIASITIYAIGRTEEDVRRPKVPYYTTNLAGDAEQTSRAEHPTRQTGRVASSRWRQQPASSRAAKTRGPKGTTRGDRRPVQVNSSNSQLSMLLDSYSLEEFADEPTTSIDPIGKLLIAGKPIISDEINTLDTVSASLRSSEQLRKEQEDPLIELQDSPDRIQSDKWIAYERYLYQKYLDILSQSIDLIMHTILGSWLALLLDEDSDQCFGVVGGSSSERATRGKDDANRSSRRYSVDTGARNSQAIYNYNGVRYSIRPDTANEPPTRVVVR